MNTLLFDIHIESVYNVDIDRIDWNSCGFFAAADRKIKRYVPEARALVGQSFSDSVCRTVPHIADLPRGGMMRTVMCVELMEAL